MKTQDLTLHGTIVAPIPKVRKLIELVFSEGIRSKIYRRLAIYDGINFVWSFMKIERWMQKLLAGTDSNTPAIPQVKIMQYVNCLYTADLHVEIASI
jgi:hypothetical protein